MKKFILFILLISFVFGAKGEFFTLNKKSRATSDYFDNHSQYISFMKLYISTSFNVEVGDEVGVYVEDKDSNKYGILIGSYKVEASDIKDSLGVNFDVVCFGSSTSDINSKDGAFDGDKLYYKFYDKSLGKVYEVTTGDNTTFSNPSSFFPVNKYTTIAKGGEIESISLLSLSASSKNFILGESSSFDVLINGGVTPYTLSYNINVVDATINSNILTITPLSVGSTEVIVTDSISNQKSVSVSVTTNPFYLSTNGVEFNLSNPIAKEIVIYGGVKPYSVSNISNSIINTSLTNDKLSITPTSAGSSFITISDSASNSQIVAISINNDVNSTTSNNSPIISTINLSASEINENEIATISVVASDSDGDSLTSICSAEEGSVTNSNNTSTFRAPYVNSDKDVVITCFVSDGETSTSSTTTIKVKDIPSSSETNGDSTSDTNNDDSSSSSNSSDSSSVNYAPTIGQIYSGTNELNENSSIVLLIIASDSNGDDLNYSCIASSGGISNLSENSVLFTAPSVGVDKNVSIICFVTDGEYSASKVKEMKIINIPYLNTSTEEESSTNENTNNTSSETNTTTTQTIPITFESETIYEIKNGWNLLGNSTNKEIDKTVFEEAFPKNLEVWGFNGEWYNFSESNINILPRSGFWLKSPFLNEYNITLASDGDGRASIFNPKSRSWSLMGAMNEAMLQEIQEELKAVNIWKYDSSLNAWFNAINNPTKTLKVGDGYWVLLP